MSERTAGRDHRDADDRALHIADHLTRELDGRLAAADAVLATPASRRW